MKCDIALDTTLEQTKAATTPQTNRLKTRPTINSLGGRFQRNTQKVLDTKDRGSEKTSGRNYRLLQAQQIIEEQLLFLV